MYKCPSHTCSGTTGVISTDEETRLRKCHSCGCHFKTREEFTEFVEAPAKRSRGGKLVPAPFVPLEEIVWRLFHEEKEVRIEQGDVLSKGCRCDPVHIRDVIAKFPAVDRAEMADDDGDIVVDCEFCSRRFPISLASFNN